MIQIHNIPALYNNNSTTLILGSFPSVKSRETEFFYGYSKNRFWTVLSKIFNCNEPKTIEQKKNIILNNNLALWDVIEKCEITGSSDSSIKDVIPNNLLPILQSSKINRIFTNGKISEKLYIKYLEPITGIKAICLPSTSPANAAWDVEKLVRAWTIIK